MESFDMLLAIWPQLKFSTSIPKQLFHIGRTPALHLHKCLLCKTGNMIGEHIEQHSMTLSHQQKVQDLHMSMDRAATVMRGLGLSEKK
jgi:hypothetical protein